MLVSFSLKNYKSFRERAVLSLVARRTEKSIPGALISAALPGMDGDALLPAVAIYGANASGKSNFLLALNTMKSAVIRSQADWKPATPIPVDPHVGCSSEPTEFEVEILIEGVRYRYGFTASKAAFWKEWLFSYPRGRERMLFMRETTEMPDEFETSISVGGSFSGAKREHDSTVRRVRNNSLLLSAFAQDNQRESLLVYHWFARSLATKIKLDFSEFEQGLTSAMACDFERFKELLESLLRMSDSSIKEVHVEDVKGHAVPGDPLFRDRIKAFNVRFLLSDGSGSFPVDFDKESRGVKRLYALASHLITALAYGYTLVVDELETSMHAHVASQLLALFQSSASNPRGAQLVFSTHETRLLNLQHLRRDQIWFCEKEGISSELYPLIDFSPRKDENFESGYLRGRYGAVPQATVDPFWIEKISRLGDEPASSETEEADA